MAGEGTREHPHLTVWTYPWDVSRLGVDAVLADIADHGIDGIDLAATYHPISALSPRGDSAHGFFCPRGAVFFPARPERYGRVKPMVWREAEVVGAWVDVAERLDSFGLELNAWTIALFQPWIAQDHPYTARVYADGARLDSGICICNPDVQEYFGSLIADMTEQFPIHLVKLEGMYPPAFDYGWTRRRVYFELTARQQRLLGLCFCESCIGLAAAHGLDVGAVRRAVLGALHIGDARPFGSTQLDAEVDAFASIAPAAAAQTVRDLAQRLEGAATAARLAVASPFEGGGAGLPVEEVLDSVAGVLLANLRADPAAIRRAVATVKAADPAPQLECFVHPPFTPTAPGGIPHGIREDLADPAWRDDLRTCLDLGVERFSLYNYGLLTPATFDALVAVAKNP